jgi:hypothetical protein
MAEEMTTLLSAGIIETIQGHTDLKQIHRFWHKIE